VATLSLLLDKRIQANFYSILKDLAAELAYVQLPRFW
jgi:hypothetical protein